MSDRRVLVIGNGMAGSRFVQELVGRDPSVSITVVGDEPGDAYNRMQLSNVLAGRTRADTIALATADWYAANGVTQIAGRAAVGIDRTARCVELEDGQRLAYDELVLATGSAAVLPPMAGLADADGALVHGAVAFRTLDDCARITSLAASARNAVVLGAGVLGIEAARGLAGRGLPVTLVQRGPRLMERQLDAEAAGILRRSLADLDVAVSTRRGVRAVRTSGGRVAGVDLDDGTALPCDLLVLCCGVRPRVSLAAEAGLPVGTGVLVDDALRSVGDPSVFAIGECAEHDGRTYGLVAPAWEQARVAAELVGNPSSPLRYRGSSVVTRLKADGLELAALGDTVDTDADDHDIVRFSDSGRGVYQKLVVRDGVLVGAILLGDTRTVGTVTQLFDRGAALPADRAGLLMVRRNSPVTAALTPTALPARATICQCNGVTKAAIVAAWTGGAHTVDDIAGVTRATTGCGTCRDAVCGLVEWLVESDTASA